MKIRIANQTYEIDEKTLDDWIRLGRVPPEASILSEKLTDGRWQPASELDLVEKLWTTDDNLPHTNITKGTEVEKELEIEREFVTYQRRRPVITLSLITLNIILFCMLDQFTGRSKDQQALVQFGAYSYHLIVDAGEYWRLLTNTFLHVGELHLILNMGLLFVAGSLLEGLYGARRFLILYILSAIGGSLASLPFVDPNAVGAGASGAIFGLMGILVALGIRHKDQLPRRRGRIFGLRLLPFIVADIVFGFIFPFVNNAAHLGGLVTGFIGAMVLAPEIYTSHQRETKFVTTFATGLVTLVIVSGVLAIQHYFDPADAIQRRMSAAFPSPSPANLSTYIERYEKEIRKRGYDSKSYAILEGLYIEAFKNDPDEPQWKHKIKQFYEDALKADPDNPVWNNNLLWFYHESTFERPGEDEKILDYIKLCERVEQKRGYHGRLYRSLQHFYIRAQELMPQDATRWDQKLETLYEEAVKKAPENGTWSNNLAWYYVEQQIKPQRAVELALNAVRQEPKEKNFLDTLGWAYLRNQQYNKALLVFEQVVTVPTKPEADSSAQESGWKGITELVQTKKPVEASQKFDHAFLKFYERLSRTFAEDLESQTKLNTVFDLFQQIHSDG